MGFESTSVGYKQHMYNTTLLCLPAVQDGYLPPSQTTPLLCSGASFPSAVRREEASVHIVGKWCIGCHDSSVDKHIHKHIVQTLCPHPLFPLLSLSSHSSPSLPSPFPHSFHLLYLARCHSAQFLEGITQLPCLLHHLVACLCPLLSILQFHAPNAGQGVSGVSEVSGVEWSGVE